MVRDFLQDLYTDVANAKIMKDLELKQGQLQGVDDQIKDLNNTIKNTEKEVKDLKKELKIKDSLIDNFRNQGSDEILNLMLVQKNDKTTDTNDMKLPVKIFSNTIGGREERFSLDKL